MIPAVIERGAGIDVGRKFIEVCVMIGEASAVPSAQQRKFSTLNEDLERLRQWLTEQGVTHVAMESTGSYWRPVYNVLDDGRLTILLANSQHVKNLRGHKTDSNDARWLAHLLRHGMIRPSFVPDRGTRELRDLTRRLAFLEEQIAELDRQIAEHVNGDARLKSATELVQTVPGFQKTAAAALVAETGPTVEPFPKGPKLAAWVGTAPGNNITGGKRRSCETRKGNPWARRILVECAWSASRKKDSEAQRFYERVKPRLKHKVALVATAHMLTLQVYDVLSTGEPYVQDHAPHLTTAKAQRLARHHSRRLKRLNHWLAGHNQRCALADSSQQ